MQCSSQLALLRTNRISAPTVPSFHREGACRWLTRDARSDRRQDMGMTGPRKSKITTDTNDQDMRAVGHAMPALDPH